MTIARLQGKLKRSACWLGIALIVACSSGGLVSADAPLTQHDLYTTLHIHYFDLQQTEENCSNTTTSVSGNGNKEKIWNYLTGHGLTPVAVAGIMGNMSAESSFNPSAEQVSGSWEDMGSDYGRAVGLVQWDGSRRPAVINYLKNQGVNNFHTPSDNLLATELDYVLKELNNGYASTLHTIMKDTDPGQAAYHFHQGYEGSSDSMAAIQQDRIDPAIAIYKQFNGATSTSSGSTAVTTSSGCGTSAGLSPDCASANGVAKILCAAKAYNTISYVFGAGHEPAAAWHRSCTTIGPSCSLDCSGLVNIAVYDVTHVDLQESTDSERADNQHWQKIPLSQVQPGDLIQPDSGHVEIIDHVQGNRVYSFGAHTDGIPQPQQVGPASYPVNSGNLYLHYIGPGV